MNKAALHSKFDQLRRRVEELLKDCGGDNQAVGSDIAAIIDELERRQAGLLTANRELEDSLGRLEQEVEAGKESLREANAALKALFGRVQEDRTEVEESLLKNVQHLILPCLARLKKSCVAENQKHSLEIMESHLQEITSPFVNTISSRMLGLSPSEIRVAELIRHGKSSKEIADLLGSSERAVVFHRQSLRRKLGLIGRKLNLRTYLVYLNS